MADPFERDGIVIAKDMFSKKEIDDIKADLGYPKLPRKHLTYVRPKVYSDSAFIKRCSDLVGCDLHFPNKTDRNWAWLLWFLPQGFDATFYSAENPHTDLLRYQGKQFRFLVPLHLEGHETLTYLPPDNKWVTIDYSVGDMYVLQAGRTLHYATVSGKAKMLLVMDLVEFPDKVRPLQQRLTQYFHTVKLSMDVHEDAVIPKQTDIKSGELTRHVTPFLEGRCPRLLKRLQDMFLPLHVLPVHQSRKAIAKVLGQTPLPKRIVLSEYYLSISRTELEDIAEEIRSAWTDDQAIEVIVSENFITSWDERLFFKSMKIIKLVGSVVGNGVTMMRQSPVRFMCLMLFLLVLIFAPIYNLFLR